MKSVMHYADKANSLADTVWKDKRIDGHLYLQLCPNVVDVMEQVPPSDGDWTKGFEQHFLDESKGTLGEYCEKRMDWEQLRDWYEGMGFVSCDRLRYRLDTSGEQAKMVRNMHPRSFEIGRPILVYPSGCPDLI